MGYTRRLRIGTDGTIAYGINSTNNFATDQTYLMGLSDTNVGDTSRINTSTGNSFPLYSFATDITSIFFGQNTRIEKFEILHVNFDYVTYLEKPIQLEVSYSTDTTDGIDGTWTNDVLFGGNVFTPEIVSKVVTSIDCVINTCKGIRIKFHGDVAYGTIKLFNLFGEHLNPTYTLHDSSNTELTGDNPLAFVGPFSKYSFNTELLRFKVKNLAVSSTAFNISIDNIGSAFITDYIKLTDEDSLVAGIGSVDIEDGLKTAHGTSTTFSNNDIGKIIKVGTQIFLITNVASATEISISPSSSGTFSTQSYSTGTPMNLVTTQDIAQNDYANIIMSLLAESGSQISTGQVEFSIDVMAA